MVQNSIDDKKGARAPLASPSVAQLRLQAKTPNRRTEHWTFTTADGKMSAPDFGTDRGV